MAKQITSTVVPRLRFPEFRKAQAWDEKALVEACEHITQGGTPDTSNSQYWDGGIAWLTPAEMGKSDSPQIASTTRTITEIGLTNCSSELLPEGSVIISTRAPIGHLAINTVPMAINQGCKGLIPGGDLDCMFLLSSLSGAKSRLIDLGAGNTFKELSASSLKNFVIPIPRFAEQQKIADCLTSLNEVIAAQGRKAEALKAHKRGLMQQLFPRIGETRPRLRFPEFHNAPEWEVKKLSALIDLVSGMHLSPDQYSTAGDVPYFTGPSDFTNDMERVTKWAACSTNTAKKHDTLITVKGSGVGECWYLQLPSVAMGRQLMAVRAKESSSQFIHQFLLTKRVRFEDLAAGNLIPGLARGDILDLAAAFPKIEEQQRIADCLSSIDTQITAESTQLAALKTHKQGLMQQLFPSPEGAAP